MEDPTGKIKKLHSICLRHRPAGLRLKLYTFLQIIKKNPLSPILKQIHFKTISLKYHILLKNIKPGKQSLLFIPENMTIKTIQFFHFYNYDKKHFHTKLKRSSLSVLSEKNFWRNFFLINAFIKKRYFPFIEALVTLLKSLSQFKLTKVRFIATQL